MRLSLALALLALAAPAPATLAQGPSSQGTAPTTRFLHSDSPQGAGPTRVDARLVAALAAPSAAVRAEALHAVVTLGFAAGEETADLRPAVPALLTVLRTDPDWRLRALALRALETTGDRDVMAALRGRAGRETHPAVQRLLFAVLVDHYGVDALRADVGVQTLVQSLRDRAHR